MKKDRKYLQKRGRVWYMDFTAKDGTRFKQSLRTSDVAEARQKRDELLAPFQLGSTAESLAAIRKKLEVARRAQAVSIDHVWSQYESHPGRPDSGKSTLEGYEGQWRQFREWLNTHHAGVSTLYDVTDQIAADYAGNLDGEGCSPSTFNQHTRTLRRMFALLTDLTPKENPWGTEKIRPKKRQTKKRRKRALTPDEVDAVLEKAPADLRELFIVGGCTGQRLVDCVSVRKSDLDRGNGVIRVRPEKTQESDSDDIWIPILPRLAELLESKDLGGGDDYVFPELAEQYKRNRWSFSKRFRKLFEDCGIAVHKADTGNGTGKRAIVDVGFHSTRHTFVSEAVKAGVPSIIIKRITGHDSDDMLLNYVHLGKLAAIGNGTKALPAGNGAVVDAGADTITVDKSRVAELADKLNGKTWRNVREELLSLAR